jgi:RNA polymerase sigma-70 factor, ECF subfamily
MSLGFRPSAEILPGDESICRAGDIESERWDRSGGMAAMSLLERCKEGDEAAWRELFARWAGCVYRWAALLGLSASDAEDAAQDVLATAARRIQTCEAEAALSTWLFQITRRVVANARRKAWLRRWVGGRSVDDAAFDHEHPAERATEATVRRCLGQLPRQQTEVLVMHDILGFTREECARILGVPPGTVASRLLRGQAAFRSRWKESGPPEVGQEPQLEEIR